MKYRPRSCYERSPQSFGGLRSDRSAAQPGRPPGLGRSSRNDTSITDRANTRMGGAKRYPSILVAKMMGFAKGSTHPTRCLDQGHKRLFTLGLPPGFDPGGHSLFRL